jgi:N6-adenosine-specific RNA methylase IME4
MGRTEVVSGERVMDKLLAKVEHEQRFRHKKACDRDRAAIEAKQARRAERERELGRKQLAMPTKRYGVVYADPPWRFQPYSDVTGMDRSAANHYPLMDLAEIAALPVPAADDAVLFLWATMPMLLQAGSVMGEWGFEYKTGFVWIKDRIGTGYWARNQHELLLIGTRGKVPAPAPGTQYSSVIEAAVGKHSAKPVVARKMIEVMFPTLPRIELFARERVEGWDCWGNEVPTKPAADPGRIA